MTATHVLAYTRVLPYTWAIICEHLLSSGDGRELHRGGNANVRCKGLCKGLGPWPLYWATRVGKPFSCIRKRELQSPVAGSARALCPALSHER